MESGLGKLASSAEVNVDEIGVGGAKNFFEAKVNKFDTFLDHIFCKYQKYVSKWSSFFITYLSKETNGSLF